MFIPFEHAKPKTKLSLHRNDTWRRSLYFDDQVHATPVNSERSSWSNFYSCRETPSSLLLCVHLTWAPVCVHTALDNAVRCRITDAMIPEQALFKKTLCFQDQHSLPVTSIATVQSFSPRHPPALKIVDIMINYF